MTRGRLGLHGAAALAIALVARTVAYALSPAPDAAVLEGRLGGPRLLVVAGVAATLAVTVSLALLAVIEASLRERARLERAAHERPPFDASALVVRAVGLLAASAALFTGVESTIHWRAGYGFHPLHCLVGPVHVNAVPILAALALVASAGISATDRMIAWARRTLQAAVAPPKTLLLAGQTRPIAVHTGLGVPLPPLLRTPARGPPSG
jgi:hypothetical protein